MFFIIQFNFPLFFYVDAQTWVVNKFQTVSEGMSAFSKLGALLTISLQLNSFTASSYIVSHSKEHQYINEMITNHIERWADNTKKDFELQLFWYQ